MTLVEAELLAALKKAVWRLQEVERNTHHDADWEDLQAVIDRAEGETNRG